MLSDREFTTIMYDILGAYIDEAVAIQNQLDSLFLLGKAAAYVDRACSLRLITEKEAKALLTSIELYRKA